MIMKIPEYEEIFWKKRKEENLNLKINITNIVAIICKIVEIYTMGSLAFRPQVNWYIRDSGYTVLNSVNAETPKDVFVIYIFLSLFF